MARREIGRAVAVPTFSVLRHADEWDDPRTREAWARCARESRNVNALYASPEWFDCLRTVHDSVDLALLVAFDELGAILDVVPLRRREFRLPLDISGRVLWSVRFEAAEVLGSIPTMTPVPAAGGMLLKAISSVWPTCDAIYLDVVPLDSPWQSHLRRPSNDWIAYGLDGPRPWFLQELPDSPEVFLNTLGAKTRATLRRKIKKLAQVTGVGVNAVRVDSPESVAAFLAAATDVSQRSWQHRVLGARISTDNRSQTFFEGLARHQLLRAYLLTAGGKAYAFVVGYQYQGVFHYAELGYDAEVAHLSPGTILLFL